MTRIELKSKLKKIAVEIRQQKSERKQHDFGYVPGLNINRYMARHLHIAYGLLRGRKYEEIEQKCRVKPDMKLVEKIMEDHSDAEDVRASA